MHIMILTNLTICIFVYFFIKWVANKAWEEGIKHGREQVLNEDIVRLNGSSMTDRTYHQALTEHVPQLLED